MLDFFLKLFGTDFMPHAFCLRTSGLIRLNGVSDALIAAAYFLIPLGLLRLVRLRRDLAFHWLFVLFAVFILSCGATHILSIVTLWHPIYRFDALIKVVTAVASMLTAVLLIHLVPRIAVLPSPEQWRLANIELTAEIEQRNTAEAAMRSLNSDLESRVEERTRQLEEQNRRLQDLTVAWQSAQGIIRDEKGCIDFWSDGSEHLYGWTKAEAVGKISHQLLRTQFPKPLAEIESELSAKGTWSGELIHTTKQGAKLHVATHWILRPHSSNGQVSVIEVNNDITDRLRAEEAMQRLADLVESTKDAIIGSTVEGQVTSWNTSAEALFGYSAQEMIGQSVHILTPPDRRDEEIRVFKEAGKSGGARRYETVRLATSGREIDVSVTVSPIRNAASKVIGTSMIVHDISEAKAQEEAIRLSEERQRLAVEAGQVGLWYVDIETGRSIWSQLCKEMHGIQAEAEVPPYPFALGLIHPDDRDAVEADMKKIMQGASNLATEYRTRGLDMKTRWVQSYGRSQRDASGKVIGVHGTVIDLTARREIEDKLRRVNTELEQFAYAAAHDLQEPLRNVALAAELLKTQPRRFLEEKKSSLLDIVVENARRMEAMVKDLLAYSRSLDGVEDPLLTDANLVLAKVLLNLSSAIGENVTQITNDNLPVISMQETHLLQIFQNLIGNALKYRSDIPLTIHIGAQRRASDILIFVKDNGIGISPQFHNRAFGMFKRLHDGSVKGTGIGLALCKRIVEHYGGHIWIESQLGQGATFFFSVPTVGQA